MENIKVSIITVTYNAEKYIDLTLDSISKQNYFNYELIVIDALSNDNTIGILQTYYNRISKIKIISEKDNGIYDAMNKGVNLSEGSFILFLNAGDMLFNETVLSHFDNLVNDFNLIYYGDALGLDSEGNISPYRVGQFSKYRLSYTNICHQTIFYPRVCFFNERFDLQYKIFADWVFNMRMMKIREFAYLNFPVVIYDLSGISSYVPDKVFKKKQKYLIIKYLGFDSMLYLFFRKIKKIFNNSKNK